MEQENREQWLKNRVKTNITNLVIAKATNNELAELRALCYLMLHHLDLKEMDIVNQYIAQVAEVLPPIPFEYQSFRFLVMQLVGNLYFYQKLFVEAIPYLQQALTFPLEVLRPEKEANILKTLGDAYFETDCFIKSVEYLEKALIMYQALNKTNEEYLILLRLGDAYLQLGVIYKAYQYLQALLKKLLPKALRNSIVLL